MSFILDCNINKFGCKCKYVLILTYLKLLRCLPAILVFLGKINQTCFHQFRIVHLFDDFTKCRYDIGTVRLKLFIFLEFIDRNVFKCLKFFLSFGILFDITI